MQNGDTRRSLIATMLVVATVFAAVGGSKIRDRMEAGADVNVGGPLAFDSILASKDGKPSDIQPDKDLIDESAYFYQLTEILEKDYVDPIKDERDLAIGSVRGMVASLNDPYSVFYKPEQNEARLALQSGTYSGIGVELMYDFGKAENAEKGPDGNTVYFPSIVVSSVAKGGAADRAGMKIGDRVDRVNGKWILSYIDVEVIREIRRKFDEKKITQADLERELERLRYKFESSTSNPGRAADALTVGDSGTVDVSWIDAKGKRHSKLLSKSKVDVPAVSVVDDVIKLKLFKGADAALSAALDGRNSVTLDLRESTLGDYEAMRACLELLAPKGHIGWIERSQAGLPREVLNKTGRARDIAVSLIVDDSTRGAAQALAHALVASGVANVAQGALTEDVPWIETFLLPDGSAYSLRTGSLKTQGAVK